jgi:protein-tyrosine-phosphatase
MAAALLAHKAAQMGDAAKWQISSAGTWTTNGLPPMPLAREVLSDRGLDISQQRSQLVDAEHLSAADVILVMTRNQLDAIRAEFPETAHRTFLLSHLVGQAFDIEDPVEGTIEDYQRCVDDIAQILDAGYDRLVELAEHSAIHHPLAANEA